MESQRNCREIKARRRRVSCSPVRKKIQLLWVVLALASPAIVFSVYGSEQEVRSELRVSQTTNDETYLRILQRKKRPEKGHGSNGESSSESEEEYGSEAKYQFRPHEPTPAPTPVMEKPSLGEKEMTAPEETVAPSPSPAPDALISIELEVSAALLMDPLEESGAAGDALWSRENATELASLYHATLQGIVKALEFIITQDVGFYLESNVDEGGGLLDSLGGALRNYIVFQKSTSVVATRDEDVEVSGTNKSVAVTWVETEIEYSLQLDGAAPDEIADAVANAFDGRHGHRPPSPGKHKSPQRAFNEKMRELRDMLVNSTVTRIMDGTMLQWVKREEDRAVGISMRYGGNGVTYVDIGVTSPNGTGPFGSPGPPIYPFNDPLDASARDDLQKAGFLLFLFTCGMTMMLCLLSGKRSSVRQKSLGSTAKLGTEDAISDLLEWSDRCMPPQYRHRRDDCAPVLVLMPSDQWEDPSALYPHDPAMQDELRDH